MNSLCLMMLDIIIINLLERHTSGTISISTTNNPSKPNEISYQLDQTIPILRVVV